MACTHLIKAVAALTERVQAQDAELIELRRELVGLEELRGLIQIAREGCYQVLDDAGVTIIATRELGELGRRAGYKPDEKYGNLVPAK